MTEAPREAGGAPRPRDRWLVAAGLSLAVLVLSLCLREDPSPDTWFHLAAGRGIVAHGAIPRTNVYLAFERDHAFVNHEWLFQVAAWGLYSLGGETLLGLAKTAVVLAAFVLLARALRPAGRVATVATVLLAALVAQSRFLARPEIVSLAGTTLVLALLERDRLRPRRGHLLVAGAAQVVWANSHGFALLGPGIAFAYVLAAGAVRLLGPARAGKLGLEPDEGALGRSLRFLAVLSLASLVNPFGLEGALYPVLVLTRAGRDWSGTGGLYMRIVEIQSPFSRALSGVLEIRLLKLEIVLAGLGFLVSLARKKARLEHAVAALALLATSFSYLRNVPFAAVGLALPLAHGLGEAGRVLLEKRAALAPRLRPVALGAALVLALFAARATLDDELHENAEYDARAGLGLSDFLRYDEASAYLDAHPPAGALFNNFGAGHFLIFARGDRAPLPYICGNTDLYSKDYLVEYHEVISGKPTWSQILDARHVTTVLVDHRVETSPELIVALARDPAWRLTHLDSHALIFERISPPNPDGVVSSPPPVDLARVAHDPGTVFSYRDERSEDTFAPVRLLRDLQLLPRRRPVPLERLHVASLLDTLGYPAEALALARHAYTLRPDFVPALYVLSSLERRSDPAAAEKHALELAALLPGSADPLVWAGLAALAQGRSRDAAHDFEEALEREPDSETATVNLLGVHAGDEDTVSLKRALARLSPPPVWRAFYEGEAARLSGDLATAVARYEETLAQRPDLLKARERLAESLYKGQAYAPARDEFEACVRADPADASLRRNLALARLGAGDRAGARRAMGEAAELAREDPQPLLDLGRLALEDGDLAEAERAGERAFRVAKGKPQLEARALLESVKRARN